MKVPNRHVTDIVTLTTVFKINFVMLLKWQLSMRILAKFDNIENMKVENMKHPFICKQLWQFLAIFLGGKTRSL
jgi:hypothetical protein